MKLIALAFVCLLIAYCPVFAAEEVSMSGTQKRIYEVRTGRVSWLSWLYDEFQVGKEMFLRTGKTLSIGTYLDCTEEVKLQFGLQASVYETPAGGRFILGWQFQEERGYLAFAWASRVFKPTLGISHGGGKWGVMLGSSLW